MRPRIGSLFSGYGGLDLAVMNTLGGTVAWHVECEPAPSKILAHHWPEVPNLHDVTTVDWAAVEPVDILTGGYPCQPFSAAGQRKGTTDDRHLWPYVRQAIRALRPRYTILENVAGHRSLGFDRVLGDLAEDRLHARWVSVRASDVGAPHHRERLFILATPADGDSASREALPRRQRTGNAGRSQPLANHGTHRRYATPTDDQVSRFQGQQRGSGGQTEIPEHNGSVSPLPHTDGIGRDRGRTAPIETDRQNTAADRHSPGIDWGTYAPAVRRWELIHGPAPAPTEPNSNGKPRLAATFAEWMMGLPAGHITDVPGVSRADQLKAIGNGVCPQQAAEAIRQLMAMEAIA